MSKCWYCNEELTTANYCEEHIGICTKCYGSMFKVGNDFVKDLTDKIADLEAKLAEYEAIKNKYKTIFLDRFVDAKVEDARIWKEEYDKLKQQLAKKEKQHIIDNQLIEAMEHNREKDKILFAVEKLEKVKEYFVEECEDEDGVKTNDCIITKDACDVAEFIDNQIEELKKEMK